MTVATTGIDGRQRPGAPSPGLFRFATVVLLSASILSGCGESGPESQAVERAEVVLGGRATEEHVVPGRVVVHSGGVVVFRTVDRRLHTVEFAAGGLAPEALAFLERTGQMRSPPLLERGTEYTVSFEGAPAGFYPFLVFGPGTSVEGAIVVE